MVHGWVASESIDDGSRSKPKAALSQPGCPEIIATAPIMRNRRKSTTLTVTRRNSMGMVRHF